MEHEQRQVTYDEIRRKAVIDCHCNPEQVEHQHEQQHNHCSRSQKAEFFPYDRKDEIGVILRNIYDAVTEPFAGDSSRPDCLKGVAELETALDRKSTRLNSSHVSICY